MTLGHRAALSPRGHSAFSPAGRARMLTRSEQARIFMVRAKEFEDKAALQPDRRLKQILLELAEQYRRLAAEATRGPRA